MFTPVRGRAPTQFKPTAAIEWEFQFYLFEAKLLWRQS